MDNQFTVNAALITAIAASVASLFSAITNLIVTLYSTKKNSKLRLIEMQRPELISIVRLIAKEYSNLRSSHSFSSYWNLVSLLYAAIAQIDDYGIHMQICSFISDLRELSEKQPFEITDSAENAFYGILASISQYSSKV